MKRFQNKTVIITGAGAGMGKEAALMFASEGANVVVNSVTESGADTVKQILKEKGNALFVKADVGNNKDCERLVKETIETFCGVDVLVNAAGIVVNGNIESAELSDLYRSMEVNVYGTFIMSRLTLPYIREKKGCIVNVCSTVAIKGVKNRAIYSATKGAVLALSRSMAAEYVGEGIRINCVSPGTVVTPSFMKRVEKSPDPKLAMTQFIERQPMGRLGTADEVARAILFAADPAVGFMTGANIVVDGGMTI